MKFKVGDRVRCIDDAGVYNDLVTDGRVYRVQYFCQINGVDYVYLHEPAAGPAWFASRFELAAGCGVVAPKNRSRVDAGPSWGF